ncbi:MAG: ribonuclease E/G [Alphaproteobacteria bacterium]|nr:MAG: ribonuclease E/G [Alphaproteobacteria bacterium]
MAKKMLIDATHPEETRVVVVQGNRVEEFDYESANKRQLRGNIYLAKVTRVEPSLQAAFVDYGGNRHGFLAFSEIHPDYYQIPVADREALAAAEAEAARREASLEDQELEDEDTADDESLANGEDSAIWAEAAKRSGKPLTAEDAAIWGEMLTRSEERGDAGDMLVDISKSADEESDEREDMRRRRRRNIRRYKIQEVIKRRQILLVQVTKEERGNKGAALTTYLSLAGRYSVLMPNTARGGGISRKIANVTDRKRLKSAVSDLNVPDGMGLIIRTAGANRNKSEIKRDYEYLLRLWESVRELTLKSSAPALVYEEGSLIKRSIRDLYNKDIDSVIVEGEEGYKEAKAFMKMLIPSHAKNVQSYRDPLPLFQRHQVEAQLDSMFNPTVQLKSGGYLVINPTEALVSIDVNSGRATREHSIEDTAYKTNLEAAEEVARQLRLRDLAGLIVIDFIDMDEHRNNRAVERKLKDSLKTDRARIQVGRISSFGLMEMSRQRMRSGLHEGSTVTCPHCEGTGLVKSTESASLSCIRAIEEEGIRARTASCVLKAPADVAMYLLNQKRSELSRIEQNYLLAVTVEIDASKLSNEFEIVRGDSLSEEQSETVGQTISMETGYIDHDDDDDVVEAVETENDFDDDEEEERPARRRRRRSRGGRRRKEASSDEDDRQDDDDLEADDVMEAAEGEAEEDDDRPKRKRRRGRRGGKRNRRGKSASSEADGDDNGSEAEGDDTEYEENSDAPEADTTVSIEVDEIEEAAAEEPSPAEVNEEDLDEAMVAEAAEPEELPSEDDSSDLNDEAVLENTPPPRPAKRGWWQRKSV